MKTVITPAEMLKREQARAAREKLELAMLQQLRAVGLTEGMQREYRFDPVRQFRGDFCWVDARVMLEVDGATFSQGRHSTGIGYAKDCSKRAAAVLAGWRVFNVTSVHIKSGAAVEWIEQALRSTSECAA